MAIRILGGVAALAAVAVAALSGGVRTDATQLQYLPSSNTLRTVTRYGDARRVAYSSLGNLAALRRDRHWLTRARPLGSEAPGWARRMYLRSLLVLRALTDRRSGAVIAGLRNGWSYVWPRDASAVAMALASAGYRDEGRRIVRFLQGLDLGAAARFQPDGTPVDGRGPQGDAAGWVAMAAKAAGLPDGQAPQPWRNRPDYQEGDPGDYLGNAIASTADGVRDPQELRGGRGSRARGRRSGFRDRFRRCMGGATVQAANALPGSASNAAEHRR